MDPFKTAVRQCPTCLNGRVESLHTQHFLLPEDSPLPKLYDVVACPECGMVYADTPVAQSGYDRYYAQFSKYEDPCIGTGGGSSEYDRQRFSDLADQITGKVDISARVLDLGCAGGGLLVALRERGFSHLHGADAAQACVSQVRAMRIPATCLPLSELPTLGSDGRFDLVIASHVFEHVVDLRTLAEAMKSLTTPGGLVYVETPDANRYAEHAYVPFYFFDSEHINHFDTTRLAVLGQTAGFLTDSEGTKTLRLAPEKWYPACWVWLRSGTKGPEPGPLAGDPSLRNRVAAYVEQSRARGRFPKLEQLARAGREVIVWGAGSLAQRLFGEGSFVGCNVVAIVDRDRNKLGKQFAGRTVERPESALARHPEATIVVAAAVQEDSIVADLRAMGSPQEFITLTAAHLP